MVHNGPLTLPSSRCWQLRLALGTPVTQIPQVGRYQGVLPTRGLRLGPLCWLPRWVHFWDGVTNASRFRDSWEGVETEVGALPHSHQSLRQMRVLAVVSGEGLSTLGPVLGRGDEGRAGKFYAPGSEVWQGSGPRCTPGARLRVGPTGSQGTWGLSLVECRISWHPRGAAPLPKRSPPAIQPWGALLSSTFQLGGVGPGLPCSCPHSEGRAAGGQWAWPHLGLGRRVGGAACHKGGPGGHLRNHLCDPRAIGSRRCTRRHHASQGPWKAPRKRESRHDRQGLGIAVHTF